MSAEHRAWLNMKWRVKNSPYYAGRIRVCKRWSKFENFLTDMGPKPSSKHSLDRKDNDGNYTPKNCRWATKNEQNKNRRHFAGTFSRPGEKNGNSKLTKKQVAAIRRDYTGEYGQQSALARKYGVGHSMIQFILNGKNWRSS